MLYECSSSVECRLSDENYKTWYEHVNSIKTISDFSEENCLHLAADLLTDTSRHDDEEVAQTTLQMIKKIESDSRKQMERFSVIFNKWHETRKKILACFHEAEAKFSLIHRTSASMTFVASTLETVARAGVILYDLFDYDSIVPFNIISILGGISLTSSMVALSYSKNVLEDLARDMRDEKRLHIDLETIYRKGNSIDDSVQKLFPYGVDMKQIKEALRKRDLKNTEGRTWSHILCSVIILTNLKKNRKILEDENFLQTVKTFVRSNAAQLWFSRIKTRMLLDEMSDKSKSLDRKKLSTGNEAFLSLSAINLYPILFSLFLGNESFDKVRLVSSVVTAILTARKVAGKEKDEFRELRQTRLALLKEYKKIRKMNKYLSSDYE